MALMGFRRSTLLEASGNLVPLALLVVWMAPLVAAEQWRFDLLSVAVALGLLAIPAGCLVVATAVVARSIQADEG